MHLVPAYEAPPPIKMTNSLAIQLAWERDFLLDKARKNYKTLWKLIRSKGTSSMEYQELFIQQQAFLKRIHEINSLLEEETP